MNDFSPSHSARNVATFAFAAIVILICLFGHLGALGLVGPDEPRYAWIARDMAATGDWVTPRLYGQPWFEKPVLYYWTAALGFRLHLPAEWAARLPSAFAALVAALAIGWLGWKFYGGTDDLLRSPILLAPLLFSTSIGAIAFARAAAPDMLFSAAVTLAMASAAGVLRRSGTLRAVPGPHNAEQQNDTLSLLQFGASLGLAVLAKGPAGVVLAAGAIGLWALVTSHWRAAFRLAHPVSVAAFCIVALPWYILCALRNPDFIRVFIFQHNFERYLTPVFQHRQPFWFFVPIALIALLPWTLFLIPAVQEGLRLWREKLWSGSPGLYFSCWALFPLLFFSFSQSKLPGYILPSVPALALLCSIGVSRAFSRTRAIATTLSALFALTWCALITVVWLAAYHMALAKFTTERQAILLNAPFSLVGVSALLLAFIGFRRKPQFMIAIFALAVGICVEFAGLRILPLLDPLLSARPYAAAITASPGDRFFTFHLPRAWNFGFAFYFGRELPEWSPGDPGAAHLLTTPEQAKVLERLGRISGSYDNANKIVEVSILPAPR